MVQTINVAYRGNAQKQDAFCPYAREDVDASGAVNVSDVVKTINVAFRGQAALPPAAGASYAANPCN